jgi:hypothetical protein
MGFLRKSGKLLGQTAGFVLGEPIKFVGKKLGSELVTEIGDGVKKASTFAGDTVGQVAGGVYDTAAGLIGKDEHQRNQGLGEIGEAIGRTARGVVQTGKGVYVNGKDVYEGLKDGNRSQLKSGAAGIVKTAAVATIAIGVVDFIEGADTAAAEPIDTPNDGLAGGMHPETGVPFESKEVVMPDGKVVEGVFPDFEEAYAAQLPESMYMESDAVHFHASNMQLAEQIQADPQLAEQFSAEQQAQIAAGQTPDGYTWHHSEVPGRMELVDEQVHAQTGHLGGRELWGGGAEHRG